VTVREPVAALCHVGTTQCGTPMTESTGTRPSCRAPSTTGTPTIRARQGSATRPSKGYGFKAGATIGNFQIETETDHTTLATQCINFNNDGQNRNDYVTGNYDGVYWVWGSNAQPPNYPKILYSY
jgi:hypothetical protein